jgi:hypothetical protein
MAGFFFAGDDMKKDLFGALALSLLATTAVAQPQPRPAPQTPWNTDSQARAPRPGTVTSHNPDNAAIAKIEAAGKNPNPGPRNAPLSAPGGPGTAENNSGGR